MFSSLFICLSVSTFAQKNFQTDLQLQPVANLPLIRGLFSGFVTIGRYEKWLANIRLLRTLIRQMAAVVRRALAEVCTVPVLFVFSYYRELLRSITFIFTLHLDSVKMNQRSKCGDHTSFSSNVIVRTHTDKHTPDRLIYLDH